MKIETLVLLVYFTTTKKADPIKAPLTIIGYDDISPVERQHLQYLEEMSKLRAKRSGHSFLSILGNGLKSKLSSFAKASASASGHFSSSSSGSYHHPHDHDEDHHEEHDYEPKTFDFWTLNKSILNTLLQAVKAIKGATIALTGKLIKGSGYLVSAKGKLISHGGDAVSDWGKKIATSAILSPAAHGSHSSSYSDHSHEDYHQEYGPSSHDDAEVVDYSPEQDLPNKYLPGKYSSYEELDTIPLDVGPQFSTESYQEVSSLRTLEQLPNPRSLIRNNGSFHPTPLTNPDFTMGRIRKSRAKRPNVDVIKSITYELRPNGPIKI